MAKRRKKNPSSADVQAAIGLGAAGAVIGAGSAALAGRRGALARAGIGALSGAVIGGLAGALLPKGGSGSGRSRNPLQRNPVAISGAVVAGTMVALIPTLVALDVMSQKIPAPSVTGTYGTRRLDVIRKGKNWAWTSQDLGGAGVSRREALEDVLGELAPLAGPNDHVNLFFERPTIAVEVVPLMGDPGWTWALSTGEVGVAATRGAALIAAMDAIDGFGQPL